MQMADAPDRKSTPGGMAKQFALAMDLPIVLVAAILVGGFLGWLLDRWIHTPPVFMILLGALGFFAGIREIMARLGTKSGNK
jgi:ATP synthase protein I